MRILRRSALGATAALAIALTSSAPVHAQAANPAAEALFQDARKLFAEKKFEEACPKFAQSQKLEPKLGTLLNLAVCHQELGKTASAWAEFTSAANLAKQGGRTKRETFARQRADELAAKLSKLKITAPDATDGLTITVDGKPFARAMLGTPLPVDPGTRVVAASAAGKKPWRQEVEVPVGPAEVEVAIPKLDDAPVAKPEPPPPPPAPIVVVPPPPPPKEGPPLGLPVLSWVGFGVGAAGLIAGGVTGGLAFSKSSDIEALCPNQQCTPEHEDELDSAILMANVSNVSFAVGGAGVIVGIVGLLLPGDDDTEPATKAYVKPVITPNGVALTGAF